MKINVYSIYDNVARAYSQPYFTANSPDHILGIRAFSNMVSPGSMLFDNPNDYALFYLGEFDDSDGVVYENDGFEKLCSAQEIIDARVNAANTHDVINNLKGERTNEVQN